ncbi:MAG: peptidylprolyl isomerase [Anaerolineae bacterium]|jgi:foldase protein PrsA
MFAKRSILLAVLAAALLALAACGSPTETPTPPPTATTPPQQPVQPQQPAGTPQVSIQENVETALAHIQRVEGTLATVDGEEITWVDYEPGLRQAIFVITRQYGVNWADPAMQERLRHVQNDVLKQTVDRWLLRQIAADEGITVDESQLEARIQSEKDNILSSSTYSDWDDFLDKNGFTDDSFRQTIHDTMLLQAFAQTQQVAPEAEQVHIAHIVVGDEATAQKVFDNLQQGQDFETLVGLYSVDPETKDNGGDLGWFTQDMMDPQVGEMAFSLAVGQYSEPIGTPRGYAIIKVLDRDIRPLEALALQQRQQQAVMAKLEAIRQTADIEYLVDFAEGQQ